MPEMLLRQPGFKYNACGPFTENKERIHKFKETGYSKYIYQNEIDKAWFQNGMPYGDFKDLPRRTASGEGLPDKAFTSLKIRNMMDIKDLLLQWFITFFDRRSSGGDLKTENMSNQELAKELHKPIIRKFEKRKVCSSFLDNIWGADLADMQLISKFNKRFRFLLSVIDIYRKYAWVVPLKDKKVKPSDSVIPLILGNTSAFR